MVQHQAFPYLQAWLGLREVAVLEPKPGVEPSLASLAAVKQRLAAEPAVTLCYRPRRALPGRRPVSAAPVDRARGLGRRGATRRQTHAPPRTPAPPL